MPLRTDRAAHISVWRESIGCARDLVDLYWAGHGTPIAPAVDALVAISELANPTDRGRLLVDVKPVVDDVKPVDVATPVEAVKPFDDVKPVGVWRGASPIEVVPNPVGPVANGAKEPNAPEIGEDENAGVVLRTGGPNDAAEKPVSGGDGEGDGGVNDGVKPVVVVTSVPGSVPELGMHGPDGAA